MLAALTQLAQSSSYYYTTDYSTTNTSTASTGAVLGIVIAALIIGLITYIFFAICMVKIFKKAGRKDSWAGWVPIYNSWVLFEIAGKPGWWALAGLIPFVGGVLSLVLYIIMSIELSKSFGKSGGFVALLILLPWIAYPMLAFGKSQYTAPAVAVGASAPQQAYQAPAAPDFAPVQGPAAPAEPAQPVDGSSDDTQPPAGPLVQ